jgi:WD40 repeat protein
MNEERDEYDPVYALAATSQGTLFAGRRSGLFRSGDGVAWASLPVDLLIGREPSITALAGAPAGDVVFAGGYGCVVRLTTGDMQQRVSVLPRPLPLVTALVVSPDYARDGVVLAGTAEDGVFRSTDRGERWTPWNIGLLDHHIIDLAISPMFAVDETVFAATETGVFFSINGGRSWRTSAFPSDNDPVQCLAVSSGLAYDVAVYAGTESGALLISRDQGRSWRTATGIATGGQPINALACVADTTLIIGLADRLLLIDDVLSPHPGVIREIHHPGITTLVGVAPTPGALVAIIGGADGRINRWRLR